MPYHAGVWRTRSSSSPPAMAKATMRPPNLREALEFISPEIEVEVVTPWNGVIRAGTNWRAKPIWAWCVRPGALAPAIPPPGSFQLDPAKNYTTLNPLKRSSVTCWPIRTHVCGFHFSSFTPTPSPTSIAIPGTPVPPDHRGDRFDFRRTPPGWARRTMVGRAQYGHWPGPGGRRAGPSQNPAARLSGEPPLRGSGRRRDLSPRTGPAPPRALPGEHRQEECGKTLDVSCAIANLHLTIAVGRDELLREKLARRLANHGTGCGDWLDQPDAPPPAATSSPDRKAGGAIVQKPSPRAVL